MAGSSSNFRDTLQELIEASPKAVDHPSPDQWMAYHRGELAADEETRFQEHLVRCRDCFDLAEGAADFAQPDEGTGAGQEVDTAALWRLLRPQLDPQPNPPRDPPRDPPPQNVREISAGPPRRQTRGFRLPMTLAASFFVALVGLAAWNLSLRGDLEELRAPKPGAPIVYFSAGERLSAPGERTLPVTAGPWMLVFPPAEPLPAYRLTLRDETADEELGSYVLEPDEDLALTLHLPEGLPPGRYRFDLSDGSGERTGEVTETFFLRVTEPVQGE